MTISSTVNRNDYIGTGATDTYPYTYKIFADTDLLVTERDTSDVETTLTLGVDYTVTGVGNPTGGNVVLSANLTASHALTIRRVRPQTQITDIKNQGDYFPETHEDTFDHLVMLSQQQQDEIDRSMRLPETISPAIVSTELPVPVAEMGIRWNATATALENFNLGAGGTIILPGTPGVAVFTGGTTFTSRTITAGTGITVTNGTGVAGNPTIAITAGGVTETELNTSVAGNGITGGGGTPLTLVPDVTTGATVAQIALGANGVGVTVDNTSIAHSGGTLSIKANGVGPTEVDKTAIYDYASSAGIVRVTTLPGATNDTRAASTAMVQLALATLTTPVVVLDKSTATVQIVNGANGALWTYSVPGNTLGTDKIIVVEGHLQIQGVGGGSLIQLRGTYGGAVIGSTQVSVTGAANFGTIFRMVLSAKGATNAQRGSVYWFNGGPALFTDLSTGGGATTAVDSTSAQNLIIEKFGNGGTIDKLSVTAYVVG